VWRSSASSAVCAAAGNRNTRQAIVIGAAVRHSIVCPPREGTGIADAGDSVAGLSRPASVAAALAIAELAIPASPMPATVWLVLFDALMHRPLPYFCQCWLGQSRQRRGWLAFQGRLLLQPRSPVAAPASPIGCHNRPAPLLCKSRDTHKNWSLAAIAGKKQGGLDKRICLWYTNNRLGNSRGASGHHNAACRPRPGE
jgi:hypothetical protein